MENLEFYIVKIEDINKTPLNLPALSYHRDEKFHSDVFIKNQIILLKFNQLKKLVKPCWTIFEKYYKRDLDDLIDECTNLLNDLPDFNDFNKNDFSIFINDLINLAKKAKYGNNALVITGD